MNPFNNIPDELVLGILEFSRPDTFESLILTCRHFHAVAAPILQHHNKLRRKYRRFNFTNSNYSDPVDLDATETVTELLLDIANEPIIAQYIEHADLGNRVCTGRFRGGASNDVRGVLERVDSVHGKEMLKDLVLQSEHLKAIDQDPVDWFNHILEDKDEFEVGVDFPIAFLLSLLPNLESLTLPSEWRADSVEPDPELDKAQLGVPALMKLLVARANDETLKDQALQNLRVLHPTTDVDTQFGTDIVTIIPFLALNSIRTATHDAGVFNQQPSCWSSYAPVGKYLEVLHLTDCVMGGQEAEVFFENMTNLKILSFVYNMKDEIGYYWNINDFVNGLMQAVGSNLESLSISADNLCDDATLLEEDFELHEFEVLRHLELDTKLFVVSSAVTENTGDDSKLTSIEDMEIPALVDVLPASLCSFVLYMHATKEDCACMEAMFRDFVEGRSEQLPSLEEITVVVRTHDVWGGRLDDFQSFVQHARDFCAEKGGFVVKTRE